ncbi:hypothetical protein ACSS7Z_09880 [Microbacterium sp. A82]|uniref:hypothetical protein n=1 Tax=Microbacterium sp. A82 TaxID=3450452 RepID=UPI003F347F33
MTLVGNQTPTFEVVPEVDDYSTAEDAIALAKLAGIVLLPWQEEQVRRILGLTVAGEWAAVRHACAVPRQSGKGVVIEAVVLAKTVLLGEKVLWTAHHSQTMIEAFHRFKALLESNPGISTKVAKVHQATGRETIEFVNGARVRYSARSKSATRGLGFTTIIVDEAQEFTMLAAGAMLPVMSGQRDLRTQLLMFGTPPYDARGEMFNDTRAAAYSGGDDRLSWSEWSCEPDDRPDDPKVWARTNPSLGAIVMEDKIRDEWNALQGRPDVFRRERLGEWGKSGDKALALSEAEWVQGYVSVFPKRLETARVIGIDCTYNAEMTTLIEAVLHRDGQASLVVLDAAPGLAWVADALAKIKRSSPRVIATFDPIRTGDLTADLRHVGIRDGGDKRRVVPVTSRDLTLACDGLVRTVREGKLLHADPRLDAAAAGATRSTFDDGKGWKLVGINGADVSPLIAGALALRVLRDQRVSKPGNGSRGLILK